MGIEPYELGGYEMVLDLIEKNVNRVVGVGEVGLDYFVGVRETRETQKKVFGEFIELAKSIDKPLVVHSRSARRYALEVLFEHGAEAVVMHAFDGAASEAEKAAARGYFFSVPLSGEV